MNSDLDSMRATRFAYPVGLLLMIAPLLELAGRVWPLQWYLIQWRFQSEIAVINAAPVLMLGAILVGIIAWMNESPGVLKTMGLLAGVFGVLLLPLLVMLALDAIQIRQMARSELRGQIRNNAIVSVTRGVLAAIASLSLAVGFFKAAATFSAPAKKRRASARAEADQNEGGLLIMNGGNE